MPKTVTNSKVRRGRGRPKAALSSDSHTNDELQSNGLFRRQWNQLIAYGRTKGVPGAIVLRWAVDHYIKNVIDTEEE